jgi:hypothetical protein
MQSVFMLSVVFYCYSESCDDLIYVSLLFFFKLNSNLFYSANGRCRSRCSSELCWEEHGLKDLLFHFFQPIFVFLFRLVQFLCQTPEIRFTGFEHFYDNKQIFFFYVIFSRGEYGSDKTFISFHRKLLEFFFQTKVLCSSPM